MKILLTTLGFYPAFAWGGPVKIVYQNAQELQRRGHQVTVCCSNLLNKSSQISPGTFTQQVDGIKVIYLNTYAIPNWPGSTGPTFIMPSGLKCLFHEVQAADVVHANGVRDMIVLSSAIFSRILKKPFIIQPHGTLPHILNAVLLKRLFDLVFGWLLIGGAAAFVAGQKSEYKQIFDAGGNPNLIHIVPNGLIADSVNVQSYRGEFKATYNIPSNDNLVLFLGRIHYKKGTDLLVQSFAHLQHHKNVWLVIAGPDDGQLAEVQSLVKKFNLEKQILFTGLLSGEDIYRAFADADVFVLPCRTDTFPMAILEACQSGVPIVVSETCEIADIIDGVAGLAVPLDVDEIARALNNLLYDAESREKFAAGGQKLLETKLSLQSVGEKLETIYTSLVKLSPSIIH